MSEIINKVTLGDASELYAKAALNKSYTVRYAVRLKDNIDFKILENALAKTQERYKYLCVRMRRNESEYYYEPNNLPIKIFNTDQKIILNAPETNYHVWAVCYKDDFIYLDFFHGIMDAAGANFLLSTLLYYYCAALYKIKDHTGIRTLEDKINSDEYADQLEDLDFNLNFNNIKMPQEAFGLPSFEDKEKLFAYDIALPEDEFVKFSLSSGASPGVMIALLTARAIDKIYSERDKPIVIVDVINARPMLNKLNSHHNCLNGAMLVYSDKVKAMPFETQAVAFRGMLILASDPERVQFAMTASAKNTANLIANNPSLDAKKKIFLARELNNLKFFTGTLSYIGKFKFNEINNYIKEGWIYVKSALNLTIELTAMGGMMCLTLMQRFDETGEFIKKFLAQFDEHNINYEVKRVMNELNTAEFREPE